MRLSRCRAESLASNRSEIFLPKRKTRAAFEEMMNRRLDTSTRDENGRNIRREYEAMLARRQRTYSTPTPTVIVTRPPTASSSYRSHSYPASLAPSIHTGGDAAQDERGLKEWDENWDARIVISRAGSNSSHSSDESNDTIIVRPYSDPASSPPSSPPDYNEDSPPSPPPLLVPKRRRSFSVMQKEGEGEKVVRGLMSILRNRASCPNFRSVTWTDQVE